MKSINKKINNGRIRNVRLKLNNLKTFPILIQIKLEGTYQMFTLILIFKVIFIIHPRFKLNGLYLYIFNLLF